MADYTLTKLRRVGGADMYEVRLPDGSSNKFIYTPTSDEPLQHWVDISVNRAQRDSDYLKARAHG